MSRTIWALAAVATVAACGCGKPHGLLPGHPAVKEQVTLPPRPSLSVKQVAEKFPDGTLSVEGFARHAREMMGKPATVRGTIQSVESCPAETELCPIVPHLVLVDEQGGAKRKLFVVSDPPEFILTGFPVKTSQTLAGTVAMWSPDGRLIDLDGVLVMHPPEPKPDDKAEAKKL